MTEAHIDLAGFCSIYQGEFRLTEHNRHAVTTTAGGNNINWRLTYYNPGHEFCARELTIALVSGALTDGSDMVNVLTLGEKTDADEIQIYLRPLQNPTPKSQLWTLQGVIPHETVPATRARLEYPNMSAGVGILNIPLPKIYLNVAAGPNNDLLEYQKWKLDFFLP